MWGHPPSAVRGAKLRSMEIRQQRVPQFWPMLPEMGFLHPQELRKIPARQSKSFPEWPICSTPKP